MRPLFFLISLALVFSFSSCSSDSLQIVETADTTIPKSDPCIDEETTVKTSIDYLQIELPDGSTFTGLGTPAMEIKLNGEDFVFTSIISDTNLDDKDFKVQAIYFLINSKKHSIWAADFVNREAPGYNDNKLVFYDSIAILGGTGEFECANGVIIAAGHLDIIGKQSIYNVTLSICNEC